VAAEDVAALLETCPRLTVLVTSRAPLRAAGELEYSVEPLTVEDVLNICDRVKPKGLIVQFGGQTPLNLAKALENAGAPIIGTSVDSIDIAEDRRRFQDLVERLGLKQPANGLAKGALGLRRKIFGDVELADIIGQRAVGGTRGDHAVAGDLLFGHFEH